MVTLMLKVLFKYLSYELGIRKKNVLVNVLVNSCVSKKSLPRLE